MGNSRRLFPSTAELVWLVMCSLLFHLLILLGNIAAWLIRYEDDPEFENVGVYGE